ncbi:MAG: serine/threonine-protein kinase [Pseudomonadota bacterium]
MQTFEWSTLKSRFLELSELPHDRLEAELEIIAAAQPELADELTALLRAETTGSDSLTDSMQSMVAELGDAEIDARIGTSIGNFRITAHLAGGGMGDVFLAERADGTFEQQVAIKLMRSGFRSDEDARRFDTERRILARLNHPGIARVLDGGSTSDGAAYLVMEYIDGLAIDAYCRNNALTLRERIALFRKVCAAVDCAHSNLVVHRDIKPSNILVTHDGQPKLLDFGIAKPIDPADSDGTVTEFAQRAMTPDYASPEQVLGEPITTRSDVYSLGILLYELLVGRRPYSTAGMRASERESVICDTDPAQPSASALIETDFNPVQNTFTVESAALRGDIDAIVMTALRKQSDERYASVQALSEDLDRYLTGQPVSARGRTLGYLTRKFMRRHRVAAGISLLLVSSAIGATTYHTKTVSTERDLAQAAATRSDTMLQFLTDVFEVPADKLGTTVTAKEILDIGAARLDTDFGDQPQIRADLGLQIADVFYKLRLDASAEEQYEAVIPIYTSMNDTQKLAYAELGLGNALRAQDDYPAASEHYANARAHAQMLTEIAPMERYRFVLEPAYLSVLEGDYEAAQKDFEIIMAEGEQLDETASDTYQTARAHLAQLLDLRGDSALAEPLMRATIQDIINSGDTSNPDLPVFQFNLANMLKKLGRPDEAEPLFLESYDSYVELFGQDSPQLSTAMTNIGGFYQSTQRPAEARDWLQRAVEHARRTSGPVSFDTAYSLRKLARLENGQKNFAVAEPLFLEAIQIFSTAVGSDHPHVASSRVSYAMMLNTMERHDEALLESDRAYDICIASLGDHHGLTYTTRLIRGQAQLGAGQLENAQETLVPLFQDLSANQPNHWGFKDTARSLVTYYEAIDDGEQAAVYQAVVDGE